MEQEFGYAEPCKAKDFKVVISWMVCLVSDKSYFLLPFLLKSEDPLGSPSCHTRFFS